MTTITDTDKGGQGFQKQRVYLGPSLGWSEEFVQPSSVIVSANYNVQPGDGLLLVDAPGPVTINLPDVVKWFQQPADQPATGWNRQLCIKDFGGHASLNPITVVPFGAQNIDKNIGPTTINVDHAVFLLVPNVNLTGWIIAAGTTSVLIPVGTYLPVHDPAATGKLTVRELGGDIAYMQGGPAGSQSVSFGADVASADADVNVNINPKGIGGTLFYSQGALQATINGAANANKFLVFSGGTTGAFPTIASSFGGRINIRDSARVGPLGGNQAFIDGSVAGQSAISYQADPLSVDPNVNVHLIPKGGGGVNCYSSGALQASIVGPGTSTDYLVISGTSSFDDPVLATAMGGPIRVDDALVAGPPGGNFCGIYGSAAGGQSVAVRADNVFNPDAVINIDFVPKGTGGACLFWSSGSQQAIVAGPAGANRLLAMSGAVAPNNPTISTAFGGSVEIPNLVMTGVPTCPTAAFGTNTTQVASTAFVLANAGGGGGGDVFKAANQTFTGINQFNGTSTGYGGSFTVEGNIKVQYHSMNVADYNWAASAGGFGFFTRASRGGGVVGTHGAVALDDNLGQISFSGSDGTSFAAGAVINGNCDAAPTAGIVPGRLVFSTRPSGGNVTQRMEITKDGAVNIGPQRSATAGGGLNIIGLTGNTTGVVLEDYQAAAGSPVFRSRHSRGATIGSQVALSVDDPLCQMFFEGSDGTNFVLGAGIIANCNSAPTAGHMPSRISFHTENGTNFSERMRLHPSGGLALINLTTDPGAGAIAANFAGPHIGVANNSSPVAGQVGEYIEAIVSTNTALGSAGTMTNVNSISLTAGDWDVWVHSTCNSNPTASMELELTITSATISGDIRNYSITYPPVVSQNFAFDLVQSLFRLNATTTVFLVSRAGGAGQNVANSIIKARRRR